MTEKSSCFMVSSAYLSVQKKTWKSSLYDPESTSLNLDDITGISSVHPWPIRDLCEIVNAEVEGQRRRCLLGGANHACAALQLVHSFFFQSSPIRREHMPLHSSAWKKIATGCTIFLRLRNLEKLELFRKPLMSSPRLGNRSHMG